MVLEHTCGMCVEVEWEYGNGHFIWFLFRPPTFRIGSNREKYLPLKLWPNLNRESKDLYGTVITIFTLSCSLYSHKIGIFGTFSITEFDYVFVVEVSSRCQCKVFE